MPPLQKSTLPLPMPPDDISIATGGVVLPQANTLNGQWLGILGALAVVTMTWLPLSYVRMVLWPWVLVWQLGCLALGGWLLWQIRRFNRPFYPLGYGVDGAIALTGASLIICSLASDFPLVSLGNIVLAAYYGIGLYGLVNWVRQSRVTVTQMAGGTAGVIAVTAIISLILWRPTPGMWQGGNFYTAIRNHLPFGHHNFVGGFFALGFPFIVACALAWQGWQRWLAAAGAIFVGLALYASGSRGALLGAVVWLVVTAMATVLNAVSGHGAAQYRWRNLFVSSLALALGMALFVSNPRVRNALNSLDLVQLGTGPAFVIQDGPILDRYFMVRLAANIFSHHPLTGVGPGVMARVSNFYRPLETGLGLDHIQQLHNTPAQLLGEMGLLGLGTYLVWLVLIPRLWFKLWRQTHDQPDRCLLYGIGGSYLAYGVSSLTDYQLENIGISALLTILLALLVLMADRVNKGSLGQRPGGRGAGELGGEVLRPETGNWRNPPPFQTLSKGCRTYVSLAVFTALVITMYLWAAADLSFALGQAAVHNLDQGRAGTALNRWSLASAFAPWDPTNNALAGETIYRLLLAGAPGEQEAFRQDATAHFQAAVAIAPNDVWFNYNLAMLLLDTNPAVAGTYVRRAIQLLPRSQHYMYYLLGQTYLNQGHTEKAIAALSLAGAENPEFLVMDLWHREPFAALKPQVLSQALALHQAVLTRISPATRGYEALYNQSMVVRWWHGLPLLEQTPADLSPTVQALIAIDASTHHGADTISRLLAEFPDDKNLKLLQAWLKPKTFVLPMLTEMDLAEQEQEQIRNHLHQYRHIRQWLSSLSTPVTGIPGRQRLDFAYRNGNAQRINLIIPPAGLDIPVLLRTLQVFPGLPREFPALDQVMERVRKKALDLPGAVHNEFQIGPLPTQSVNKSLP